jgi:hypothetical protein
MPEELGSPDPGTSRGDHLGNDQEPFVAIDFDLPFFKTVPLLGQRDTIERKDDQQHRRDDTPNTQFELIHSSS